MPCALCGRRLYSGDETRDSCCGLCMGDKYYVGLKIYELSTVNVGRPANMADRIRYNLLIDHLNGQDKLYGPWT